MAKTEQREQLTEAQLEALKGVKGNHGHALHAWEPGTPEHAAADEELYHLQKVNPRLYTKIANWD